MGSGASALPAETQSEWSKASVDEIAAAIAELPADQRQRLAAAAGSCSQPSSKGNATSAGDVQVTAAAGENEDGVDTALELELSKQELLFQKCLRGRAERDMKKKLEKEERKAAAKALKEKAMEAAFDGEIDVLLGLFEQNVHPDFGDEHGTTLLSEACAGGGQDVVEMLLGEGCDPNSIGRYRRTPLWRAAYAGQSDLIRMLLRGGSDPRECDEQGAKPIDVASNPPSKELLLCWDTSATDKIAKQQQELRGNAAKKAATEEKQKSKRQSTELDEAIEEATRKRQISKSELARTMKLLHDYRAQKISLAEIGQVDKIAELEPLLEGCEIKMKMFEAAVAEWDWKISRAELKMSDFKQAEKEKAEKKSGKFQGFKLPLTMKSTEDIATLLAGLTKDLEAAADMTWGEGEAQMELSKGDTLIKDGPFSHLRRTEFTKKVLEEYGQEPPPDLEAEETKEEGAAAEAVPEGEEKEPPFPLVLNFSRGFSRTIEIKSVADVLMKDVGDLRKKDGRWPLVIDPSGRTSTFIQYTGATVFSIIELADMDPLRLKKAFLRALLHGSCLIIDLGDFAFDSDTIEEPFSKVEKGLFKKLVDRSVVFSYLLPRRFRTLLTKDVQDDFIEGAYMDEHIQKFVLGFVTSSRSPDFAFAKQFYTIKIKEPEDDEEQTAA